MDSLYYRSQIQGKVSPMLGQVPLQAHLPPCNTQTNEPVVQGGQVQYFLIEASTATLKRKQAEFNQVATQMLGKPIELELICQEMTEWDVLGLFLITNPKQAVVQQATFIGKGHLLVQTSKKPQEPQSTLLEGIALKATLCQFSGIQILNFWLHKDTLTTTIKVNSHCLVLKTPFHLTADQKNVTLTAQVWWQALQTYLIKLTSVSVPSCVPVQLVWPSFSSKEYYMKMEWAEQLIVLWRCWQRYRLVVSSDRPFLLGYPQKQQRLVYSICQLVKKGIQSKLSLLKGKGIKELVTDILCSHDPETIIQLFADLCSKLVTRSP